MSTVSADEVAAIERVEMDAWLDIYAAAPVQIREALGIEHRQIGGGALLLCAKLDNIQFNRLTGLGVARPVSADALDAGIAAFDLARVKNWIVHVAPGTGELEQMCTLRGLTRFPRTWAKFIRDTEPIHAQTKLAIREIGADQAELFGSLVAVGFGLPPVAGRWVASIVGRLKWRCYMAFDGGVPVATGAAYVSGKTAWLGVGSTLASHRGRGAQSAILAARINAAREAGCTHLTTETGIPNSGEPAPSFKNIQRAGFRIAYERPNYRRELA